jgi:hypothetical protein
MTDFLTLREIQTEGRAIGKRADQRTAIAIAHGLAYDPHVDGRLRLTPPGRVALAAAPDAAQGSLLP